MEEDPYQFESIAITIPKKMPRPKKISEVSRQLSEWLESHEKPYNFRTNMLRLKKFEQTEKEYIYHYEIQRKVED
jgi:hypothetical protein